MHMDRFMLSAVEEEGEAEESEKFRHNFLVFVGDVKLLLIFH